MAQSAAAMTRPVIATNRRMVIAETLATETIADRLHRPVPVSWDTTPVVTT